MEKLIKLFLGMIIGLGGVLGIQNIRPQEEITLLMTGDVSLGRSVNSQIIKTNNPCFPFEKVADFLKSADFTLINLESVLTDDCPLLNTGMKLCGDAKNVAGLLCAGVDIASVANNHQKDFGQKGLEQTVDLLKVNNIAAVNHNQTIFKEVKGIKLSFLAFDLVGHNLKETELQEKITAAKKNSQLTVVVFHWGSEYQANPNSFQQKVGRLAIDSGADLVLGNHPHWVQTIEEYQGKLIVYSHGNFIFDQSWSEKTKEGIIGKYVFKEGRLASFEFIPIKINNLFQPDIVK